MQVLCSMPQKHCKCRARHNYTTCQKMPLIIDLDSFHHAKPTEIADWLKNRPDGSKSNFISIVNELKPSYLYLYFHAKFGPPNGIQNFMRSDDSDNLVHWDWTFKHENGLLSFWGMNRRTEILFIGNWDFAKIEKEQVIRSIKNDFKNFGAKMSKLRKDLPENWETFVNPYHNLESSIRMMEKELEELQVSPKTDRFPDYESSSGAIKVGEIISNISKRYIRAYGISKSLQALTPVMAESFLNLLLLLFMKKEVRENERVKDSVIRANIDVKVQALSLHCNGFQRPVDWKNEACVNYNRVINNRNDILHGNIVISKLKTGEIYFNGRVPVFKQYSDIWEQLFERRLEASGFNHVADDLKAIRDFVSYVLDCLDPTHKRMMMLFMERSEIGRNFEDGRFGILLPEHIADMMPRAIIEG